MKVTSEELDEWPRSVGVVGEDERRQDPAPLPLKDDDGEAAGRSRSGKQPRGWSRRSSLDFPTGDRDVFGIDAETLLLASNANDRQAAGHKVSETHAVSDLEASPAPSSVDGCKPVCQDALFARGQSRLQDQPRCQSHFFRAMERSRETQGHDVHSRRSLRLMMRTELTRMMLLEALGEALPEPPTTPGAMQCTSLQGVGRCRASDCERRTPYPDYGRRFRNKRMSAGDIAPTKGLDAPIQVDDPGGCALRPIRSRRQFVYPSPRKEEEDAVRAELRRIEREQMMAEMQQSSR